jgi:FKBP-type peptidyl-prolyl cis-trans isomerase FklB
MKEVMMQFRQQLMQKVHAQAKVDGEKNAKSGETFLAENAKKEGVKTTASGLQYKVVKSGTGKTPKADSKVKVHYHGTLANGEVFDSSVERGEPVTFAVNQVIAGWTEALQLMKEGDKWQLVIPSKLAYGERGAGGKIGPNAVLIFDVELLEIQ